MISQGEVIEQGGASLQEPDGIWRRWLYGNKLYTYIAYAAAWLGQLGQVAGQPELLRAAARHLDWVMSERDPQTGGFRRCGFSSAGQQGDHAYTHTIAYTLAGVLGLGKLYGREDAIMAARQAALRVARMLELRRFLPGVLDPQWEGKAPFACLTGNAQMALIWFDLHRLDADPALVSAACRAIDLVKTAQPMHSSNPTIRGGIAGSDPVWGTYVYMAYPNWAAKYFIDALLAKRPALEGLVVPPAAERVVGDLPIALPASSPAKALGSLRVVLLAGRWEERARKVVQACEGAGVRPVAVIVETARAPSFLDRIRPSLRDEGVGRTIRRVLRRILRSGVRVQSQSAPAPSFADHCRSLGIEHLSVECLESAEGVEMLRGLAPDLAVHSGAGILRRATLEVPRLGILNAHMGLLPWFRGMDVAEWSVLYGHPVGCTVHLIDEGVDTGDILCRQTVDWSGAQSVRDLWHAVDQAQLALLGKVLAFIAARGELPQRHAHPASAGRQFFRLHPAVLAVLESHLRGQLATPQVPY